MRRPPFLALLAIAVFTALQLVALLILVSLAVVAPRSLAAVVAGLGCGGYEVGVNALQADLATGAASGQGMSLLHTFYGVGALAGSLPVTPGLILKAKVPAFRVPENDKGKSTRFLLLRLVPTSGASLWSRGCSAVTTTESVTEPTSSVASMRTTSASRSSIPTRLSSLKLGAAKMML